MIKRLIMLLALLTMFVTYLPAQAATPQNEMVALVNQLRASVGVAPLRESCILDASAQQKAEDFNTYGFFAHTNPYTGETAESLKRAAGYPANSPGWGENILWSGSSVQDAFNIWADSPDHYNNMVSGNYTEIGIGIDEGAWGVTQYWGSYVMHFGNANTSSCGGSVPPSSTDSARTTTSLNLRTGPSLSASIIRVLPVNTLVTLIGGFQNADGYRWANVSAAGSQGWVATEFVTAFPTTTPVPTQTATPTPTSSALPTSSVGTTTTAVNFRTAPSLSASIIRVLPMGTAVSFLGPTANADGYAWANVVVNGVTGWIATLYVFSQSVTVTPTATIPTATSTPIATATPTEVIGDPPLILFTNARVNMRDLPTLSGAILTVLARGTPVAILGGAVMADGYTWTMVQANDMEGWVATRYIDGWVGVPAGEEEELVVVEETSIPTDIPTEEPTFEAPTETPTPTETIFIEPTFEFTPESIQSDESTPQVT